MNSYLRRKIRTRKTIDLFLTAGDWDLYSGMEGVDGCADRLNSELERCVNEGMGLQDTRRIMLNTMEYERSFGASDTEPVRVLDDLLDLIYGDSDV